MSSHLEEKKSRFIIIKRSGQTWTEKIYITLSTKLSKKEISKKTKKKHHEVKGERECKNKN